MRADTVEGGTADLRQSLDIEVTAIFRLLILVSKCRRPGIALIDLI